jgi:hypothetical protein
MKNYPKYCKSETSEDSCNDLEYRQQKKSQLSSVINIIWRYLLKIFPDKKNLLVRQQSDCFGNTWWTVYDPVTSCCASFGSATDMLTWIKQYYSRRYL